VSVTCNNMRVQNMDWR